MKKIRFQEGNDLTLYIPLVLMSASGATPLAASSLTNVKVDIVGCCSVHHALPLASGNSIKVQLPAGLKVGAYSIEMSASYEGRSIHQRIDGALECVGNTTQSNWHEFVPGSSAQVDTQIYIAASLMTDDEFEALKQELTEKIGDLDDAIGEAEEARDAYVEAVEDLEDMAKQSTLENSTYGLQALKTAIEAIPGGGGGGTFPTDYAKETTAQAAKTAAEGAKSAAEAISIPTDYAKESTASDAKTAAQSASALCTIIDGKLASRNAENEPVSVGAAVGGVALSIGADIDGQPLHDKVDALAALIGDVETLIAAL